MPGKIRFPIPCLNGNMIYLHQYFETAHSDKLDKTIGFFAAYQRFDDGDFQDPKIISVLFKHFLLRKAYLLLGSDKIAQRNFVHSQNSKD